MADALLVVQCRFASSRLYGKALYPFAGLPMIVFLLRRLRRAFPDKTLVLATTCNPEDDMAVRWARDEGVPFVRGSEQDVLARFCQCLDCFPAKLAVRITGDNPLTEPSAVTSLIQAAASGRWHYLSCLEAYPRGLGVDAFDAEMLRVMDREVLVPYAREHLNAWPLEHLDPTCIFNSPPVADPLPDLDCSIDTLADWQRVRALLAGHPNPLSWSLDHA